jgi:hypothetical protein
MGIHLVYVQGKENLETRYSNAETHQEDNSTPCLGKQSPHRGCLEFCEEGTSVNTSEMADISMPI